MENAVKSSKIIETSQSWNGVDLPNYPTGKPQITVLNIKIPPKSKLALHQHPIINVAYVIKGTLTVTIKDGMIKEFHKGEVITECVNTTHFGENKGDEEVELVVFYAGTPGTPLSVPKE